MLTVEEERVGLGDDDEGEGDEEEADDEDEHAQPPRLLPEAPHQLRALHGLHLLPSSSSSSSTTLLTPSSLLARKLGGSCAG